MQQEGAGLGQTHFAQRQHGVGANIGVVVVNQRHQRVESIVAVAAAQRVDGGQNHFFILIVEHSQQLQRIVFVRQLGDLIHLVPEHMSILLA